MINFKTRNAESGKAQVIPLSGGGGSSVISCGYHVLMPSWYSRGFTQPKKGSFRRRHPKDSLWTSKPQTAYGDKDCDHTQIIADATLTGFQSWKRTMQFLPRNRWRNRRLTFDDQVRTDPAINSWWEEPPTYPYGYAPFGSAADLPVGTAVYYHIAEGITDGKAIPNIVDPVTGEWGTECVDISSEHSEIVYAAGRRRQSEQAWSNVTLNVHKVMAVREDGACVIFSANCNLSTKSDFQYGMAYLEGHLDVWYPDFSTDNRWPMGLRYSWDYRSKVWSYFRGGLFKYIPREVFDTWLAARDIPISSVFPGWRVPYFWEIPRFVPDDSDLIAVCTATSDADLSGWTKDKIQSVYDSTWNIAHSMENKYHFGRFDTRELHDSIMDQVPNFSGNMIAYVRDLKSVLGTAKALAQFALEPSAKNAASAWLSTRYGDRLTVQDTFELMEGAVKNVENVVDERTRGFLKFQSGHSEEGVADSEFHESELSVHAYRTYKSTVRLKDKNLSPELDKIRTLFLWDALPTAQNIWDLIPYSFVVDWFADVEGVMSALDRRVYSYLYEVLTVVDSVKTTYDTFYDYLYNEDLIEITMRYSIYSRSCTSGKLSFSPFRIDRGHLTTKNIVDGVSLITNSV